MFATFPGANYAFALTPSNVYLSSPIDLFLNTYHFSTGISGLCYIGLGVGFVTAAIYSAFLSNQIYQKVCRS